MQFRIQIFQAWKVMESRLGRGKSWKINQTVAHFPCTPKSRLAAGLCPDPPGELKRSPNCT